MNSDRVLREELLALLRGGNAHMGFNEAVARFPMKDINKKVPHSTYTMWHLLEHMRICQWDILEFMRNPDYVSPEFPEGIWPPPGKKATPAMWRKTVKEIKADLQAVEEIVQDLKTDFFSPIPHAKDYTIFREILVVADHNASHMGELVALRRALGLNPVKEY
jgi:hypothetical protein